MSDDFHVHGPHDHEVEHVSHHNSSYSFANQIAVTTALFPLRVGDCLHSTK